MNDNIDMIGHLLERMESRYQLLDQGLDEAQAGITYGSCCMVITTSLFNAPLVVGRILNPDEIEVIRRFDQAISPKGQHLLGAEEAGTKPGTAEEEEARYQLGFRFGLFFDAEHTSGRAGHVHRSRLYPISDEEFRSAQQVGFNIAAVGAQQWFTDVSKTILDRLEEIEGAPRRLRCGKCGSPQTAIRTHYQGRMDAYGAKEPEEDVIRLGGLMRDEVGKVLSRHVWCRDCDAEGPNLLDTPVQFGEISDNGQSIIENVWDYGPDLPLPDWD